MTPNAALENNCVSISGKVISSPEFSHEVYGEGFYITYVQVPRLSETNDELPVIFSERLVSPEQVKVGLYLSVEGQFRSYNNYSNKGGRKLMLMVFAREISIHEEEVTHKNPNQIYLNGFVCRKPIYRTTPFGREIADILLAVNRAYNKSDYIPCITWGRNARYASTLEVGDNLKLWGRIQSRVYQKKLSEDQVEERVAYEISVSKMEVVKENNNKREEKEKGD
ncbi:MAG TPA: single-stranded DNA-binding protein [Thermoclostridium sp.]|nr:single-stranded DNA-binding protein [Thermoclostridium sp.]